MQLGLTFPLQRRLGLRAVPCGGPAERRYCWDLHCIALRGRDSLLMVHCESRYALTAFGLRPGDWADLSAFALSQLRAALPETGLSEPLAEDYLARAGQPVLTRTHGRREVAFLNRAWEDVLAADAAVDPAGLRQPLLDHLVNARPCRCAGFDGRGTAADFFRRSLQGI